MVFLWFSLVNLRKIQTLGEFYTFLIILQSRKKSVNKKIRPCFSSFIVFVSLHVLDSWSRGVTYNSPFEKFVVIQLRSMIRNV